MSERETQARIDALIVALHEDPQSIPRRLELASLLRAAGRLGEAVEVYRGAAEAYARAGRLVQAVAVCKGILEIDPEHRETVEMLGELARGVRHRPAARPLVEDPRDPYDDEPTHVDPPEPIHVDLPGPEGAEPSERITEPLLDPTAFPLFAELPQAAFGELLARMVLLRHPAGHTLFSEGDPGDACYLVVSGSVRVHKGDLELAVLGPGACFGELAVLADQRRHASVQSVEDVELLEIRRELLDELIAQHAGVAKAIRGMYRERLLAMLLATSPLFAKLGPEERARVAERFRPRRYAQGARVIDQGTSGGGLFLVVVGEVEVVRADGDAEVVLGALGEGAYFGEMSLLSGGTASATVRASRPLEVVQLPPRDFYEVVSEFPVLWEQLRAEAERRDMANHEILAGEARRGPDGRSYLV